MAADGDVFVDTNVLLQLHITSAPNHSIVVRAFQQLAERGQRLWISRQVLREYASVVTRPQPYTEQVLEGRLVAAQLRYFEASYIVADETSVVSNQLNALLEEVDMGGKQVHDANIVATMKAYGLSTLLTLNGRDFERFAAWINVISPITLAERAG